jgi:FtsZ-interacting cell division protein ZipA
MSTGTTVIIIIAIIVVVAIVAGVLYDIRRRRLRQRFGPEYDRLVEERDSRREAEAELTARERRVRDLDIRPLSAEAQARYSGEWTAVQERFVDAPQDAVAAAQRLVMTVMNERGYPTEGTDQVLADLSVDHGRVLDHYRAAYEISQRSADGMAPTEDLRQAMIHYRALFQDLLGAETARRADVAEPAPDAEPVEEPAATAPDLPRQRPS